MHYAQMVRFYKLNPERVPFIEAWLWDPLEEHLDALMALELENAIQASIAPHTKRSPFRNLMHKLRRIATRGVTPAQEAPDIIELDKAKAAKWLGEQGWRLTKKH